MKRMVVLALLALVVSFTPSPHAFATALVDLQVKINDSRPSTAANYTITIDQNGASQFSAGDTITIDFVNGDGFNTSALASTDPNDYDIVVAATEETVVSSADTCGDDEIEVTTVDTTNDTIVFTACTGYTTEAAGSDIVIEIGTHATSGGTGDSRITNPAAGTYQVNVDTTDDDAKDTMVAIIAGVDVTATIDETLTATVAAVTSGSCSISGADTTTTSTTIPYGTITTEAFHSGCQLISVSTNASAGYNAYVAESALLTAAGSGATIADGNCDGGCSDSTFAAWATATNNGFGWCADDVTSNPVADAGIAAADQCSDGTPFFVTFLDLPTNPTSLVTDFMASTTGESGDQAHLGVKLSAGAEQAAGAYSNQIFYVVTPTF